MRRLKRIGHMLLLVLSLFLESYIWIGIGLLFIAKGRTIEALICFVYSRIAYMDRVMKLRNE